MKNKTKGSQKTPDIDATRSANAGGGRRARSGGSKGAGRPFRDNVVRSVSTTWTTSGTPFTHMIEGVLHAGEEPIAEAAAQRETAEANLTPPIFVIRESDPFGLEHAFSTAAALEDDRITRLLRAAVEKQQGEHESDGGVAATASILHGARRPVREASRFNRVGGELR